METYIDRLHEIVDSLVPRFDQSLSCGPHSYAEVQIGSSDG